MPPLQSYDGPPLGVEAEIIADSISPLGYRVTTFLVTLHRFVLAELNTHRVFSRNSASSRAIPVEKQLARAIAYPAWPLEWTSEKRGMQGGAELTGDDLLDAKRLFQGIHGFTTGCIAGYLEDLKERYPDRDERDTHTLHKSLVNRLLEPFMWHTVVITATEWHGFFNQRATEFSPLAQPEIRAAADLMLVEYTASKPREIEGGQWHLPFIKPKDRAWAQDQDTDPVGVNNILKKLSSARCARTSYLTHDGVRDPMEDIDLHDKLVGARPLHASPLEHPCTPATQGEIEEHNVPGNFDGFHQYRHQIAPHVTDVLNTPWNDFLVDA